MRYTTNKLTAVAAVLLVSISQTQADDLTDEQMLSLDKPVALDIGSHVAIREGGRTVGSGVITEVVE